MNGRILSSSYLEKWLTHTEKGSFFYSPPNGEWIYSKDFLSSEEAASLKEILLKNIHWKQEEVKIFGKRIAQPRLTAWYGDEGTTYTYSGLRLPPEPWIPALLKLKKKVEAFCGISFNSVLLNQYRHGQDSMGWHSDDEKELGIHPVIASLSLGENRTFQLKHKSEKDIPTISFDLPSGSLFVMKGETQTYWKHQVPKTKKSKAVRINLTFRFIH